MSAISGSNMQKFKQTQLFFFFFLGDYKLISDTFTHTHTNKQRVAMLASKSYTVLEKTKRH